MVTLLLLSLVACGHPPEPAAVPPAVEASAEPAPGGSPAPSPLPWTRDPALGRAGVTIAEALPPPHDARRLEADAFGLWLRQRTLASADDPVRTHDGQEIHRSAPFRVVHLPMVEGDLQQCADAILRLRAEWLRQAGQPVSFHATSGDPLPWSRYRAGEEPYDAGGRIAWRPGSDRSWEGYLSRVFTWAGSWSLEHHETAAAAEPRAGMVLVQGGFPGHAVLLLDVARAGDTTYFLAGQSFMPAQSFHLDLGPHAGWWAFEEQMSLGSWAFDSSSLRGWKTPGS